LDPFACLYIIRGEPYKPGTCLHVSLEETIVGRSGREHTPDISFINNFVSRKHFMIVKQDQQAILFDLGSPNGTELNGTKLTPNTPYPLQSSDIIKLAEGMIVIHFSYIFSEYTLELEPMLQTKQLYRKDQLFIPNWEKRECVIGDKRITMSEKECLLLKLLMDHANRLVSIADIKKTVWAERTPGIDGMPDASMDELNALVYRIRKKYGSEAFTINAVRGSGYILEKE
jgi:DNA-binding winged helix-turn-helix (wHTH) protein